MFVGTVCVKGLFIFCDFLVNFVTTMIINLLSLTLYECTDYFIFKQKDRNSVFLIKLDYLWLLELVLLLIVMVFDSKKNNCALYIGGSCALGSGSRFTNILRGFLWTFPPRCLSRNLNVFTYRKMSNCAANEDQSNVFVFSFRLAK